MDICSHIGTSVSEDINSFHDLSLDPPQSTCSVTGDLSVNDLGKDLTELVNIQDDQKLVSGSIPPSGKNGIEKEDRCEEPHQSKLTIATSEKCPSKSSTFLCSSKITSFAASIDGEIGEEAGNGEDDIEVSAQNGHAKSVTPPCPQPTALKLVSAMKGSREKLGIPPKKLTVTWAPEVYDPIPTAVSHVVTSRNQKHRNDNRKNSKHKQKGGGKTSRGSRGKDKKQVRKYGGTSSNKCFKALDDDDDLADFTVGSPDPYCGSSFLKKSVTKLHFSVAEAT